MLIVDKVRFALQGWECGFVRAPQELELEEEKNGKSKIRGEGGYLCSKSKHGIVPNIHVLILLIL